MTTINIKFESYPVKAQEEGLLILNTQKPNFICRAKEQNFVSVFPDVFMDDYLNDDLVTYHLPNDITVWYEKHKKQPHEIADLFITKVDGGFDEVFGNIVITSKMVEGRVNPLSDEQRDYLYNCLFFGTANGKSSLIADVTSTPAAKGGN